jgi:hypothetical protein
MKFQDTAGGFRGQRFAIFTQRWFDVVVRRQSVAGESLSSASATMLTIPLKVPSARSAATSSPALLFPHEIFTWHELFLDTKKRSTPA